MKRAWYVLAAVLLLATGCGNKNVVDEELAEKESYWTTQAAEATYPYYWEREADGSVRLTLTGDWDENTDWEAVLSDASIVEAEQISGKKMSEVSYRLKPLAEGTTFLTISNQTKERQNSLGYEVSLFLDVDEDLAIEVLETHTDETNYTVSEDGNVYVHMDESGDTATIYVERNDQGSVADGWEITRENECFSVYGPMTEESGIIFRIIGAEHGEGALTLDNEALGLKLNYQVTVAEDGSVSVVEAEE